MMNRLTRLKYKVASSEMFWVLLIAMGIMVGIIVAALAIYTWAVPWAIQGIKWWFGNLNKMTVDEKLSLIVTLLFMLVIVECVKK